ncbi:SRPBCC family protein [Paenarthrobacter aromaticivorans]|uniref:SRPBCC family protein n=1 Tax=Paenarthrobacter aromaticivorans TaxID=2849150 RepID=UPI0020B3C6B6|nr:SRPBCC family protein [Paenarthrobacter sp. MMS21-TAE1-1]
MSTVTQLFRSSAADVWNVIADGWLYSGWVVGASRIRAVDDQWPQVGSKLHHSVGHGRSSSTTAPASPAWNLAVAWNF